MTAEASQTGKSKIENQKSKIVILGAGGRMGKALIRCLLEEKVQGLELHGAVDLWDVPELGMEDAPAGAGDAR